MAAATAFSKAVVVAIAIAGDGENPVLDRDFLPVPVSVPFLALVGGPGSYR